VEDRSDSGGGGGRCPDGGKLEEVWINPVATMVRIPACLEDALSKHDSSLLFFCFPLSSLEEAGDPGMLHCFFAIQKPYILSWLKCGLFLSLSLANFNPAESSKTLNTSCRLLVASFRDLGYWIADSP